MTVLEEESLTKMSHSRKHSPCIVLGCKKLKRDASRAVRHFKGELKSGCHYKRLYNSYDIIDYIFYEPKQRRYNQEFRKLAKIVRNIAKGRDSAENYDLDEILERLKFCDHSFYYFKK